MTRVQVRRNAGGSPEIAVNLVGNDHFEVRIEVEFDSWAPETSFAIAGWDPSASIAGVTIPTRRLRLSPCAPDNEREPTKFLSTFSFDLDLQSSTIAEIERVRGLRPQDEVVLDLPVDIVYVDFMPNSPRIGNSYGRLQAEVRWSRDRWLAAAGPLLGGKRWVLEFAAPEDPVWQEVERHLSDAQRALSTRDPFATRTVLSSSRAAWNSARSKIAIHWNWQDARKQLPRQHEKRTSGGYLSKAERLELVASTIDTLWNSARHFTEMEAHREAEFDAGWDDAALAYRMTVILLSYLSRNPISKVPKPASSSGNHTARGRPSSGSSKLRRR